MNSGSFSPVSVAKRDVQPVSRSKDSRKGFVPSSQQAASLHDLKMSALRCRTPKQFRALCTALQTVLPYKNLICLWGYPSQTTIGFIFNHSFPVEILRWFLAKGLLWKSPIFREWLRTKKTVMWLDAARRLKHQMDAELLERVTREHLQHMLSGGLVRRDLWITFRVNMASESSCRTYLKLFRNIVPVLARAFQRAYPRPLLTERETAILERRAMGEIIKQIAAAQGISGRTVRMHLQRIKKKLYTDDLVNAVVIAVRSGMLDQTWKEWRWRSERTSRR